MFYYHTLKELEDLVNENKLEVWQVIEQSDMEENGRTKEQSYEKMLNMYLAMKEADKNYNGNLKSASKRAGGDGEKIHRYNAANKNICGKFIGNVMEKAIKMGESNACMRRIVAAPTAGACGVLPAVLISYQEEYNLSDDEMVKAMYVAAGIGKVIAENAFIAGAAGGCQAEIGSASAMAAGALAFLQKGTVKQIVNATALSLKNMLGLTCDPVKGLVEVPCIKRNSYGAVNAVTSAQLAMAGIESAITPDDVIDSMRRIGNSMPACLKETGTGGLAVTESAKAALLRGVDRTQIERGQVLAKPGSVHPHNVFEAQVYVLTKDEGGRHTPFFSNYRPQFYFRTTDVTGIITLPEGTEMCMPGDNVMMHVELLTPVAMEEGLRFAIREGGRTVGSGVVGKIIE